MPKPAAVPVIVTFFGVFVWLQAASLAAMLVGAGARLAQEGVTQPDVNRVIALLTAVVTEPWFLEFSSALNTVTFLGIAGLACIMAGQSVGTRLRLVPTSAMAVLFAALGFVGVSDSIHCLVQLLGLDRFSLTVPLLGKIIEAMARQSLPVAVLLVAVLPAIGEEVFFRGFIQTRLVQRWGTWRGIVVTAVLFGLLHGDPIHTPVTFLMGLVLGSVVEKTGSLWTSIVAHAFNNTLATLQAVGLLKLPASTGVELILAVLMGGGALLLFRQVAALRRPAA